MATRRHDVVVIGSGTSGQTVAHACREAGRDVAVVDKRPLGGTCALRGCDPKKVLVGGAHAVQQARALHGHGVAGEPRIAWPDLMRFKRTFTDPVPDGQEKSFRNAGIPVYRGVARFEGEARLRVEETLLEADHFVLATGAKPRPLGIPGEEHVATSAQFLDLDTLPRSVVFIGGGYISMELAHVARRAGASVTVLHRGARILEPFDVTVVRHLENATRRAGIDLRLQAEVLGIERSGSALRVRARTPAGEATLEAALVVHGAGRVAEVDELDLERAGVARGKRGVLVDEHLRSTTNPRVWACGDTSGSRGAPLTPVATLEGRVVAHNILHDEKRTPDYRGTPSVAFTLPPLAMAGMTEEAARRAGKRFRVSTAATGEWYSSRRLQEHDSAYKVLIEDGTDLILGAHLLGPNADEVVNLFALAIRHGLTAKQLKETIWAYPTNGSDVAYML